MQTILIKVVTGPEFEDMISRSVAREFEKRVMVPVYTSPQQTDAPSKLFTKKEAAQYLRVSTVTLNKYQRLGFLKGHTVTGTRSRFKQSELDKALRMLNNKNLIP